MPSSICSTFLFFFFLGGALRAEPKLEICERDDTDSPVSTADDGSGHRESDGDGDVDGDRVMVVIEMETEIKLMGQTSPWRKLGKFSKGAVPTKP